MSETALDEPFVVKRFDVSALRQLSETFLPPLFHIHRGYNIGTRLIEDFLSRTNMQRCQDFKDVGEVVSKVSRSVGAGRAYTWFFFFFGGPASHMLFRLLRT